MQTRRVDTKISRDLIDPRDRTTNPRDTHLIVVELLRKRLRDGLHPSRGGPRHRKSVVTKSFSAVVCATWTSVCVRGALDRSVDSLQQPLDPFIERRRLHQEAVVTHVGVQQVDALATG